MNTYLEFPSKKALIERLKRGEVVRIEGAKTSSTPVWGVGYDERVWWGTVECEGEVVRGVK